MRDHFEMQAAMRTERGARAVRRRRSV